MGAINTRNSATLQNPTIAANNAQFNRLDPNTVEYRQLAIPEIQYVRDQDRVDRFADYLKTTTGEELTAQQAQARLLQGSAGLMDAQWQDVYGTDAKVMDFLMTEVAQDIQSIQAGNSTEHSDALLQQQLMNSDLAYTDPLTGERRLVFAQGPGEFSDERNGIVAFMSNDTIGLIDELGVPKNPQQRWYETEAGRTQGQSDAFANTGGTLVDMVTGAIGGLWNFVSSPIETVRESWNDMKEFDAHGNLLGFQGRDYERGYIQGQGEGNAAIGAAGGEALAAFGGALLQGALTRANGGTVTVNADANGQATGFSIQDGVGHANPGTGGATPSLRFGDGDDAGLQTPLVDRNRVVVLAGEVPDNNLNTRTSGNNAPLSNTKYSNQAEADEAFKQYEIAKNTDSEVVLGRLQDTKAGSQLGMTRLNSDNWSPNVNDAFVQGGIDAGKPFYLGSSPDISNYRAAWNALEGNRGSHPQTVFFREMKQLRDAGYRLEGDYMLPPK